MRQILRAGRLLLLLLCAATAAAEARADVKIKSRQTMQGQSYENATYIKGKRQRTESMGGQSVIIQQCDLRRDIQIMPAMRAYTVNPYGDVSAAANAPATGTRQTVEQTKGGLVTSTVTTRDTGERKQMFGYTARRIITTIETSRRPTPAPPSTPGGDRRLVHRRRVRARLRLERGAATRTESGRAAADRYQMKTSLREARLPVYEKMTMFEKDGRESFSMVNEVVEFRRPRSTRLSSSRPPTTARSKTSARRP